MPPKSKRIVDCASLIDETLVRASDAAQYFPNAPKRDSVMISCRGTFIFVLIVRKNSYNRVSLDTIRYRR